MTYRIHIVEDEESLNQVLTSYLRNEGWEVHSYHNGETALMAIPDKPHLWILDIMLPDSDGFELIRRIKDHSPDLPVIFISARDADLDRIIGLEMGSDDYLAKPFMPRELVIRARKLLQRIYEAPSADERQLHMIIAPYSVDEQKRMASDNGQFLELTSLEFDLLLMFAKNQGQAFAREQILNQVWGEEFYGNDRVVDDLVRRLRKKMPALMIETMYGYGYRMVKK